MFDHRFTRCVTGLFAAGVLIGALGLISCSEPARQGSDPTPSASDRGDAATVPGLRSGRLDVFAAASLTDVFTTIEPMVARRLPGVDLDVNFAGSSTLREQIIAGAPADVIVSANRQIVDDLVDGGAIDGAPTVFAVNSLTLVVPSGNPGEISSLDDLERSGLLVGVCAAAVPCGVLAQEYFAARGVTPSIVTEEPDVRTLLAKVISGELDAGFVYRTDALAKSDDVDVVELPDIAEMTTEYVAARVAQSTHSAAAQAFIELLADPQVQAILLDQGFVLP